MWKEKNGKYGKLQKCINTGAQLKFCKNYLAIIFKEKILPDYHAEGFNQHFFLYQ